MQRIGKCGRGIHFVTFSKINVGGVLFDSGSFTEEAAWPRGSVIGLRIGWRFGSWLRV